MANFQEERAEVDFYLDVEYEKGSSGKELDWKSLAERKGALSEIMSKVVFELNKDNGYKSFLQEPANLRQKAASLSVRLVKYVGEYVSIVDI